MVSNYGQFLISLQNFLKENLSHRNFYLLMVLLHYQDFQEAVIIVIYYIVIFGGRFVISTLNLPVIKLNGLFQIHNLFLTSLSLTLLVLILEQIIPIFHSGGSYHSICSPNAYTSKLVVLYYLNYI